MKRTGQVVMAPVVLLILGFVAWDQVESRGLARDVASIAARGEPVGIPAPAAVVLTPEQRDAARLYAGAAERAQDVAREAGQRIRRIDVDGVTGPRSDLAELEATYRKDAPALQLLDQATPLDFLEFGEFAPELYTNQSPLVTLGELNALRADLLSVRGHGDAAAFSLVASARLLRTMPQTSYRWQGASRMLASLRILLRHAAPGEAALAGLQRALTEFPDADTAVRDLQRTRARFIGDITRPAATPGGAVLNRISRPWMARAARRHLAAYERSLTVAALPWPEKTAAASALEREFGPVMRQARASTWWERVAAPYGPAIVPVAVPIAALDLAARRVMIATLAVERHRRAHGSLPASLDALVPALLASVPMDPFSGVPIVYKPSPDGYLLYSVDTDRQDDGGALYGRGSRAHLVPQSRQPRDLGIRVEWKR
jgi:hypothetical protein